ncbi:terminase small subunit [Macrococcus capreoli]
MKHGLNDKQLRFAQEYIKTLNATESAKRAGYSPQTAYSTGHRMLKNVEVKKYIQNMKDKILDENILSAKEVLAGLTEIASGKTKEERDNVVRKHAFKEDAKGNAISVYDDEVQITEVTPKTSDRLKAYELLGKYHVLFTDKQVVDHTGGVVFIEGDISDDTYNQVKGKYANSMIIHDDI